jgi:hypothetical protein
MTTGTFLKVALGCVMVLLGFASPAWCNSAAIVLDPNSPGSGVYWYDLAVTGSATFVLGNQIVFAGMSGVTSASANSEVSFAFGNFVTFTNSTATFVMGFPPSCTSCPASDTFPDDQGAPYSFFEIDPPSGTAQGLIDWSIQTSTETFTGTVEGPVASTPEPSTLILLGLGMISMLGLKWFVFRFLL